MIESFSSEIFERVEWNDVFFSFVGFTVLMSNAGISELGSLGIFVDGLLPAAAILPFRF